MFEAISLFAWLAGVSGAPVPAVDPLTRPIESSHAAEWLAPADPEKILGGTYLVGFGGMSVALIDTDDGLVLVDGALPQAAHALLAHERALGFNRKSTHLTYSHYCAHGMPTPACKKQKQERKHISTDDQNNTTL